ncbi:MAG: protein kinase [Chloroflexus sp.]|nr:protein kinase [Chloroflexus sp.]
MVRPQVGDTIGHARVETLIASSGFSDVYRATDLRSGKPCAVRLWHVPFDYVTELRALFQHDARIAAALRHPHILRISEFGEWHSYGFITSEYMATGSLPMWLRRVSAPPVALFDLLRQAALALAYAHRFNIAHGDLRPAALLLTPDARYRAGQRLAISGFALGRLSSEALAIGGITPNRYLAPERRAGAEPSLAADIFAFGRLVGDLFGDTATDPHIADLMAACCALNPARRPPAAALALALALHVRFLSKNSAH